MFQLFTGWAIASALFYLGAILFLLWMVYRFVVAHEAIAENLRQIKRGDSDSDTGNTDSYKFGKR